MAANQIPPTNSDSGAAYIEGGFGIHGWDQPRMPGFAGLDHPLLTPPRIGGGVGPSDGVDEDTDDTGIGTTDQGTAPTPTPTPPAPPAPPATPDSGEVVRSKLGDVERRDQRTDSGGTGESDSEQRIRDAADYWIGRLDEDYGTEAFMDALRSKDPNVRRQALDALKDPGFRLMYENKIKEEHERISLLSNLLEVQHRNAMASIQNMRV